MNVSAARWQALVLLVVFVVGGVTAPLVHRFEHVRELQHVHGSAALDFAFETIGSTSHLHEDLLVEERTTPHELNCELCARLSYTAVLTDSERPPTVDLAPHSRRSDAVHNVRSDRLLSIRAPPLSV